MNLNSTSKLILTGVLVIFLQGFFYTSVIAATYTSKQNGSWSDPNTWTKSGGGTGYPGYDDVVIVGHNVTGFSNFGIQNSGSLTITSSGNLSGRSDLSINNSNAFINYGTVSIGNLNINNSPSYFNNYGTATFGSINLNSSSKIINDGSLTFTGQLANSGIITGTGNLILKNGYSGSSSGKLTNKYLTVTGEITNAGNITVDSIYSTGKIANDGSIIVSGNVIGSSYISNVGGKISAYNLMVSGEFIANDSVTCTGAMTIGNNLKINNTSVKISAASLSVGGFVDNQGKITVPGALSINGKYSSDKGQIIKGCTGNFYIGGDVALAGANITIGTSSCTRTFNADIEGNVKIDGTPASKITNYANLRIGTSKHKKDVTIELGEIDNKGFIDIFGKLDIGSSNGENKITNDGMFMVEKTMTTHGWSIINNNDSMIIRLKLTNGSDFTNASGAFLWALDDFFNQSKTNAKFVNGGILLVNKDFTNDWSAIFTGNGGATKVRGVSKNNGVMSGNQDFCDSSTTSVDAGAGTFGSGITHCLQNPLPVKLVRFTAEKNNNVAVLKWQTASELNNSHFEIYKSNDGRRFIKIGQIEGHGTTNDVQNYTFTDINPTGEIIYYRLKQVDFNGQYEYSPIVALKADANANFSGLNLYPNPLGQQKLNVAFNASLEGISTIEILGMDGNRIFSDAYTVHKGANTIQIDIDFTPAGLYIIRLSDGIHAMSSKFRK